MELDRKEAEAFRLQRIRDYCSQIPNTFAKGVRDFEPFVMTGRVRKIVGTMVHASVQDVQMGELLELCTPRSSGASTMAECVGFLDEEALLAPIGELYGVSPQTEVRRTGRIQVVPVGAGLMGRVLDGLGQFIDGKEEEFQPEAWYPVHCTPPEPMTRRISTRPLSMGIRALDGLLTIAEGQRVGIFAAAGGGKSTLLAMLVKGADVDVNVLALIGERGREVREFIEHSLGPDGMSRSVVVVATSDRSAMERAKAAYVATAVAEFFRDQGLKVLFLMDSVTRYARAQREIGLAAGEPPTRRGFPPSVFATLPRLMERSGMSETSSITAMYTVLVEGDDMTEPVADESRSILDGHVILSRKLAEANHYPAIDILASKSRMMDMVVSDQHREMAGRINAMLAAYANVEMLLRVGEYKKGVDPDTDVAVMKNKAINAFLRQRTDEFESFNGTLARLKELTR